MGAANAANTLFTHTHTHTFTSVSLLLALMADLCLPLSAGEDTFELHSVQLEAVERQNHELLEKQAQLRKRKATLETSRADAHKSGVSVFLCTGPVHLGRDLPRCPSQQWKTGSRPRSTTSPPPVFEISSRNRFAPLCETERDAVIIGDSIVRHVRATLAEGKVPAHCYPGAHVLDVSALILKELILLI